MAIRISGLTSGLDTDSIVQELVSAYSTKKENIEKKQTKLSWTQMCIRDRSYSRTQQQQKNLQQQAKSFPHSPKD